MPRWIIGEAIKHDNASPLPSQWSLGKKWGHLSSLDKAEYLARHAGLAVAAAPLAAIALASLPISLPAMWLSRKATSSPGSGGVAPAILFIPSMLAMAPGLMSEPYQRLDQWMQDRAGASARAHDPRVPENPHANKALEEAVWHKSVKEIKRALKAGANPNASTGVGDTPLIVACMMNDEACVDALLAAGADPAIVGKNGDRALAYAGVYSAVSLGQKLIQAGAPVDDPKAQALSGRDLESYAKQGHQPDFWLRSMWAAEDAAKASRLPETPSLDKLAARRAAKEATPSNTPPRGPSP